jgi:hypothetical protein
MRTRQNWLRGVTRLHPPSVDKPLIVVLVDELAALTGWVADRTPRKRIEVALGLLAQLVSVDAVMPWPVLEWGGRCRVALDGSHCYRSFADSTGNSSTEP